MSLLRQLAEVRFRDALALLEYSDKGGHGARRSGAVYLGGYAVECALKWKICNDLKETVLREEFYIHDLRKLAQQTNQWSDFEKDARFKYIVQTWNVDLRYELRRWDRGEAQKFLKNVRGFYQWLFKSSPPSRS